MKHILIGGVKIMRIEEALDLFLQGEIDKEDILKLIMQYIEEEIKNQKNKKAIEKIENENKESNEEENNEEENEEKDMEVITKEYSKTYKGLLIPLNSDPEDIEAIENAIKSNMKLPLRYEHTDEIIGTIIEIQKEIDGYYAIYKLNKDIEDCQYLSAEIKILKEGENKIPLLVGASLTCNPALPVKKVEEIPEKIYNSLPKPIRILAYLHPNKQSFFKLINLINNQKPIIDYTEEVKKSLREYIRQKYSL